jgi:pimeloyl-ACP methyl ester carboxylesterase
MIREAVSFYNSKGQRIAGRLHRTEKQSKTGMIYCHGLFSTKDGYKITTMAPDLVSAGYTLLTFDFSFVGESEGDISELSILQEVDDLSHAATFLAAQGIEKMHLVGSSMGGVVSLLHAAQCDRYRSLSLIATPVMLPKLLNALGINDVSALPDDGMTDMQGFLINNRFFKEHQSIDMEGSIRSLSLPALIIHGERDAVVPPDNAIHLYERLCSEKHLIMIEGGEHNLSRDSDIQRIKESIIHWMRKHDE